MNKENIKLIDQDNWHQSMRGFFSGALHNEMISNKDIYVVSAGLGFGQFDAIKRDFPDRFIDTGASEMLAAGVSIGLSKEGKIPILYTITSFLMRCAEPIALYVKHENTKIIICGGGRDQDYTIHDGMSHDATIAQNYIHALGIQEYYPQTNERAAKLVKDVIERPEPCFISLRR